MATKDVYNGAFDEKMFLEKLVYFNDLLSYEIIPVAGTKVLPVAKVKSYLEGLVRNYIK